MTVNLPEPSFISRDIAAITKEMIAKYEADTGKTLQPAQLERILIDLVAYRENLLRISIQEAAKQNLVNFAIFPMLDYLGELVGVNRLQPVKATTVIRASMTAIKAFSVNVPVGTKIQSKDGKVIFATKNAGLIPAGQLYVDIPAECEIAGISGNAYLAGEINTPVSTVSYINAFANTIETSGGADEEGDEALRKRIKEAPEQFSQAGSLGAYKFLTKSAHPDIVDVAVIAPTGPAKVNYTVAAVDYELIANDEGVVAGEHIAEGAVDYTKGEFSLSFSTAPDFLQTTIPTGGIVKIYPLTKAGNPTSAIIDAVENYLSPDTRRPLTDKVVVESPTKIDFSITANVVIYSNASAVDVQQMIEATLANYKTQMKSSLGKDIVPAQIISRILSVQGVYNAELSAPDFQEIAENEWANCTAINVNITGEVNG